MGFGYMFLGFLFFAKASYLGIDFLPDFAGYALLLSGINIARKHCSHFDFTRFICLLGLAVSLFKFGAEVYFSATDSMTEAFNYTFGIFYECFTLFFVITLLLSLSGIARETGLFKLSHRAVRHIAWTILLSGTALALNLGIGSAFSLSEEALARLPLVATVLSFSWLVLDAAVIFSCYMWICLEGDENMEDNRTHKYKTPFDILEKADTRSHKSKRR